MSDDLYKSDPRAKTAEGFITALHIFSKYWENGLAQSFFMGGEHDTIHIWEVDLEDLPEDSEDGKLLTALGFAIHDDGWVYFT